jgi:hypothetical protein
MQRRRPSWGYYPPDFSWREAGRIDRVRVLAILATILVMGLAGASDLAR